MHDDRTKGRQVLGTIMFGIGVMAAIWLGIVWLSIALHDDPGDLPAAFTLVTSMWLVWMVVALAQLRRGRGWRA